MAISVTPLEKHLLPYLKHSILIQSLFLFLKKHLLLPPSLNSKIAFLLDLSQNIIYEFTCSSCKARYIGETKRNLTHRISEHRGVSVRTRKQLAHPFFSVVGTHSHSHDQEKTLTYYLKLTHILTSEH